MNVLCRQSRILNSSLTYLQNYGKSSLFSSNRVTIRSNTTNLATQKTLLDNTNVVKDVILFKYENPRFYKIVNTFAIVQYVFWVYLGYTAKTTLRDLPVDESKILPTDPWYKKINLGEFKYRFGITATCLTVGFSILAVTWIFTLRSVRFIVLHKGGKAITLVTYTPLGQNRLMKVDLSNVSCQATRHGSRVQLPLKVKNKRLHYMLDMRGEFRNTKLFDSTAGLYRGF